ncbi:MAG: AAA family ATPase [Candidatus Pacebacteria bacterium]|nr:AAA family ATPase [Candidatus Paceibacterota bacterium]
MTQDEAFRVLTMGKNVFLTGAAGSGKTYLLNRYIRWLRERGIEPAVTASTGIAATHIGGQTIHSWSGIGIKEYLGPYELDYIEQNERLVRRFRSTQVLIIDEVSMLSANTLTLVDTAIRAGMQSQIPFGGMQVVLCGDFFQLPPVVRGGAETRFAFQGEAWHALNLHMCYLGGQFRQDDEMLLALLNSIRVGNVSSTLRSMLEERVGVVAPENVPHLYTHNVDVDRLNNERLAILSGYPHNFEMRTKGSKKNLEILRRGILVPEVLQLKEGAVVMFIKNHPQGRYVNGTLGTITGFTNTGDPVVTTYDGRTVDAEPESWKMEDGDKVKAEVIQIPLRLAWAVTVHKSQGLTLDAARIDLTKTFVHGQGYVALSRVRSLAGLYLEGVNDMSYSRHPSVAEADEHFRVFSEQIVRRLEKTNPARTDELARSFVARCGGHEPDPKNPRPAKKKKESTYDKTLVLTREHRPLLEIAELRGLTTETIIAHLEELLGAGTLTREDIGYLMPAVEDYEDVLDEICNAFTASEGWNLSPVRTALDNKYSYDDLRFARLFVRDWKE